MADGRGERQDRQQTFVPTEARDILSADQHGYTDGVPLLQQQAAQDATYNGRDAERRLGGSDG